ncbi:MAG: homocysteine S-methyltransferase family protein [Eubacteriales bacterium]
MKSNKIIILDGATGTMLQNMGMPKNTCTETYIVNNPESIEKLQREYFLSGSDAVLAPTFGANSPSLVGHGYRPDEVDGICARLAEISVENAKKISAETGRRLMVGGDMSPTGMLLKPYGSADPDEVLDIYKAQALTLVRSGVDFIAVETMISAAEAVLAVRAVREVSHDIPLLVTLTVNENGRTMSGDSLGAVLIILAQYGISGFGCNCSIGPDVVYGALQPVSGIAKKLGIPLIAKPNAGLPIDDENGTHYPLTPEMMAEYAEKFVRIGVKYLGGCCGTTPEHIKAVAGKCAELDFSLLGTDAADCDFDPRAAVANFRTYAIPDSDAEYARISDADELYDASDEADDILYLELEEGGGDIVDSEQAYINVPLSLKGDENEIEKVRRRTLWKVN